MCLQIQYRSAAAHWPFQVRCSCYNTAGKHYFGEGRPPAASWMLIQFIEDSVGLQAVKPLLTRRKVMAANQPPNAERAAV